jgi:hypothetical protein
MGLQSRRSPRGLPFPLLGNNTRNAAACFAIAALVHAAATITAAATAAAAAAAAAAASTIVVCGRFRPCNYCVCGGCCQNGCRSKSSCCCCCYH